MNWKGLWLNVPCDDVIEFAWFWIHFWVWLPRGCGFQGSVTAQMSFGSSAVFAMEKRQLFWHILEFVPRIFWYFLFHPSPHSPQFDHLCFRSFINIRPDVFKLFPHEPHFPLFWENMQIIFIKYILLENTFDTFFFWRNKKCKCNSTIGFGV